MILKKLSPIIYLVPIVTFAEASSSWVIPPPYYQGKHFLENGGIQFIEENNDSVLYAFASKNQRDINANTLWMTKCFKSREKGLSSTSCLIQNQLDKNVKVLINPNRNIVLLAPTKIKTNEVNYRIDNNQIISSNNQYFADTNFQYKLLSNLLIGNKLSYSYKLNQSYKAGEISLEGFKENYNFSIAFIRNN